MALHIPAIKAHTNSFQIITIMKFVSIIAALTATLVAADNVVESYVLKEGEVAYKAQNDKGEHAIVIVSAAEAQDGDKAKRWSWLDWRMFEPITK